MTVHRVQHQTVVHASDRYARTSHDGVAHRFHSARVFQWLCFGLLLGFSPLGWAAAPQGLPGDLIVSEAQDIEITGDSPLYSLPSASEEALESLRATFDEILRSPTVRGHDLSASIIALSSGQVVYDHQGDHWLKPASNTKVVTTAAAFDILGENWRPASRVMSAKRVEGDRIAGDVVLHGIHDLSWSELFYPSAGYPAQQLVRQLTHQGIRTIDGDVWVHGTFVVQGYHFGTLDTSVERGQAAEVFRKALIAGGVQVKGQIRVEHTPFPAGYTHELARWEGPALAPVVDEVNRVSHNEFADMLLLAIAQSDGGGASYVQGAARVRRWLEDIGLPTDGLSLHDGSGLSHDNRISASLLSQLMVWVQHQPWADRWNDSLSPAGVDGTYVNRMLGASTRGRALLKSGTINGVISTSGLLLHPSNGEVYAISLLMNQVVHQPSARVTLDKMVSALAEFSSARTRPAPPALQSAQVEDADAVVLRWRKTSNTRRYLIEMRGADSGWKQVQLVEQGQTHARLPRSSSSAAYRIRAINDAGISAPSVTMVAGGSSKSAHIVLVEGNERWLAEPHAQKNARQEPHDFLSHYVEPLRGFRVDTVTNHALLDREISPQTTVIFALGREANDTEALSKKERAWIEAHLRAGGRVLVTGAEAAWDIHTQSNDGADFLERVFGAVFIADSAHDTVACTEDASSPTCAHFWNRGQMQIKWPDALTTTSGSRCMRYGNDQYDACVVQDGAMLVGFPLESIDNANDRRAVLLDLLERLGVEAAGDQS